MVYVAHCFGGNEDNAERARQITHELQIADMEEAYICPLLAFSHLEYGEVGYDEEMEICLELLSKCRKLIIASELSEGVRREIEYAKRHNIPIAHISYIKQGEFDGEQ